LVKALISSYFKSAIIDWMITLIDR